MARLKKAMIGVGGRYHADRLATGLIHLGYQVSLCTSYPAAYFPPVSGVKVESAFLPELLFRGLRSIGKGTAGANLKMRLLGNALARWSSGKSPDLFLGWSSFCLESFRNRVAERQILLRDSSHISHQLDLLESEYLALGLPYQRDSLAEERELEEYELADQIWVPSEGARKTFIEHGVPAEKVGVLAQGVDRNIFYPCPNRQASSVLKVAFLGHFGVRKGADTFLKVASRLQDFPVRFHVIGSVEAPFGERAAKFPHVVQHGILRGPELVTFLQKMDVLLFLTLEDGFGASVFQAMACGVVPIVSEACGALELLGNEAIRVSPGDALAVEKWIRALAADRQRLATLSRDGAIRSQALTWDRYERSLQSLLREAGGTQEASVLPNPHLNRPDPNPGSFPS